MNEPNEKACAWIAGKVLNGSIGLSLLVDMSMWELVPIRVRAKGMAGRHNNS